MKEKISRLARGVVDSRVPAIEFSQSNIQETIPFGRSYRGDFRINSVNQLAFRGLIYSSNPRVRLSQGYFTGVSSLISYEADATALEAGAELTGAFLIVCNGGEYQLPYRFCARSEMDERFQKIQTIEQFAALASEDPEYARRLFDSVEFTRLPFMKELPVRAVYDALCRGGNRRLAMEEFLTGLGQKPEVLLTADTQEHFHENCPERAEQISVRRNTWGYLACTLRSDAPFLRLTRESLTDADFVGRDAEFSYFIDKSHLHLGRNYASIHLSTLRQELVIPVTVIVGSGDTVSGFSKQEYEKHFVRYMRAYMDFLAEQGDREQQLDTMRRAWEAMARLREPDVRMRLWEIEMAQARGEKENAGYLLNQVQVEAQRRRREDPDAYCYFLYLQMLQIGSWELKERLLKLLYKYQDEGQATPTICLLLLRIDENRASHPTDTLELMRSFFEQGCQSPYLYLEAVRILNQFPDVLQVMGDFELQTLWFGAKHGYLKEDLVRRVAEIMLKERGFQILRYRLLETLYEQYPMEELVLAVCALLIRGDQRDSSFFRWFEKGVEADIRLTRLYDYYLYTRPKNLKEQLPQVILLYYSYNSPADVYSEQLLYDQILTYFPPESHMYQAYEKQMQKFSVEQLLAGKIDDFLAKLYSRMLYPEMVDSRMAQILPDVLKTCRIQVEHPRMQYVILVYGELSEELMIPIRNGVAYVPMYTEFCRILFADAYGNRYCSIPWHGEPLMPEGKELLERCREVCPEHAMLTLLACDEALQVDKLSLEQLALLQKEAGVEELHPLYRGRLVSRLIQYYSQSENKSSEMLLSCLEQTSVSREERLELIQALIASDFLPEAMEQVRHFGYEELPVKCLRKLCSRTIQNRQYEQDSDVLYMAYDLFQKKQFDDSILQYLCLFYNGLSLQMYEVLQCSVSREAETSDLAERLLGQMLFTGCQEKLDSVFSMYIAAGPAEKLLVSAYFVVKCHNYFIHQETVSDEVFAHVEEALQRNLLAGSTPVICMLALTKYFAGRAELTAEERILCQEMLSRLYQKGMVFPYFKKLGRFISLPDELRDKTFLAWQGQEGLKVELGMRILPEMEDEDYQWTEMPHVYEGIYVKPVLLFAGERMDYEIAVVQNSMRVTADSGIIGAEITSGDEPNRFSELNRLLEGEKQPEDPEWQQRICDYGVKDALVEALFRIPEHS